MKDENEKVPAPTVATDNSGDDKGEVLIEGLLYMYWRKVVKEYIERSHKFVEEDQDGLWQEAIDLIDMTSQNRAVEMLKEKFILTRKS